MQNNNINSKFTKRVFFRLFVNILITFSVSSFFVLLSTLHISLAQFQECPPSWGSITICMNYDPRPPADACYNGWVPGEKKQIAVLLVLFRDVLKTMIIYLMVGHGVNMYGHIIALLQDSELIKGIACGKNQHRLGILLGIRQNQDVLTVVQEKLVI
jgi:hypothetical protein